MLLFGFLGLNLWFSSNPAVAERRGVIGGPESEVFELGAGSDAAVLEALSPTFITDSGDGLSPNDDIAGFVFLDEATLQNAPSLGSALKNGHLITYKIVRGDTVQKIADRFGISSETVLWANPELKNKSGLKVGKEIVILPISGVLYKTVSGDTLISVAASFVVNPSTLVTVNKLDNFGEFAVGTNLVIPGAKPKKNLVSLASEGSGLQSLPGYFAFPAPKNSWNWGKLHPTNAVDIANACGTAVYAAADGVVTEVGSPDNWNTGYGGYVKLEHTNGTETMYAHTSKNLVELGNFVNKGDEIAEIGKTGNVHGPTGCHLHLEVHGAKNPFAK